METILGLIGLYMLYSVVHFGIVQHKKAYIERTGYERFITWFGIVVIAIIFLDVMFG